MSHDHEHGELHDHDKGLSHDLPILLSRRRALTVLGGGVGLFALAACGDDGPPAPPLDGTPGPDGPEIVPCATCWVPAPGSAKNWDV